MDPWPCSLGEFAAQVAENIAVDEPDFAGYWHATAESRIVVRHCTQCGAYSWPPRPICAECAGSEFDWSEASQTGRLYSWTVVHRTPTMPWRDLVPYAVGVVTLDHPAVRMLGRIVAVDLEQVFIDMPLQAHFEALTPQVVMPVWTPIRPFQVDGEM
jgi:hypothetical protein